MIDLAISIDDDAIGTTIVETNQGKQMASPDWPQDSDFRLVSFRPSSKKCDVISPEQLAADNARALDALNKAAAFGAKKPEWYRRLNKCASGAPPG